MGFFNLTGRHVLLKSAEEISKLRAKIYLSEYLSLYHEAKREYSEYFNELVQKRDLIKLYLAHKIDGELIEIKQEWFSDSGNYSSCAGARKWIDHIARQKQHVIDYISETEKSWFSPTDIDFTNYSFEALKNYCEFSSLYCIPNSYLKFIYDSQEYKSTIEFPITVSYLHDIWNQINMLIADFETVK